MMNFYTPVLSDFGLSMRTFQEHDRPIGTPGFLAPEIDKFRSTKA